MHLTQAEPAPAREGSQRRQLGAMGLLSRFLCQYVIAKDQLGLSQPIPKTSALNSRRGSSHSWRTEVHAQDAGGGCC